MNDPQEVVDPGLEGGSIAQNPKASGEVKHSEGGSEIDATIVHCAMEWWQAWIKEGDASLLPNCTAYFEAQKSLESKTSALYDACKAKKDNDGGTQREEG